MTDKTKGAFYLVLSAIAFSLMAVMVKLTSGKIPLMQQVFSRNAVMLIFSALIISRKKLSYFGNKENRKYLILRSIFGFLGVVCSFYATNTMLLGDAQALLKLSPFVVTILAVLFLREKISWVQGLSLVTAFVGALFIIKPSFNLDLIPALIGFGSAFFAGSAYVVIAFLSKQGKRESGMTIIFVFSLLSCIWSLPFMVKDFILPDSILFIKIFGIGFFSALGQYYITKAYSTTDASSISIFDYTGVILAAIFGKVFFQEDLSLLSILGIGIIILSGTISFMDRRRYRPRS